MQEDEKTPEPEYVDTRREIVTEDGKTVSVGAVIPARQFKTGKGVYAPFGSEVAKQRQKKSREEALVRKQKRIEEYEEQISGALEAISALQRKVVDLANDETVELPRSEMEKLRLGLSASEMVLNRVLGKPTTKVEASVSHGIAQEMMRVADEWGAELDE